jgi:hypothetical protein
MNKTILYIDGENLRHYIKKVLKENNVPKKEATLIKVDLSRLLRAACDKKINTAISEVKSRRVQVIYLGFEINPNKGLTYTTNRTILIRNAEVLECFNKE